jgi:hypothetical protein
VYGRIAAVLVAILGAALLSVPPASAGGVVTQTFTTRGEHTFVVPPNVTSISVTAEGEHGGNGTAQAGGYGAIVQAQIPTTPGSTLFVEVGIDGGSTGAGSGAAGGTGGGSSEIRTCSKTASNCGAFWTPADPRLLVAGGGGGAGGGMGGGAGGDAGATTPPCDNGGGGSAGVGAPSSGSGSGAGGGDCPSVGAGGNGGAGAGSGSNGSTIGGQGGAGVIANGGGGGAGYAGGGGGGGASNGTASIGGGGGGGGSSFVEASATDPNFTVNLNDQPSVTIAYASQVPGAPTNVVAKAGNRQATVTWNPPASDGGDPILDYTVTSDPSGVQVTVPASQTTATLTGLQNGVTYRFTVAARNDVGTGPSSVGSNPVTPHKRRRH